MATGSVYWVLGGQVKGGRMAGDQVRVEAASLNQNRDYPVLTDYRALLGGLFQRAYAWTAPASTRCSRARRPRTCRSSDHAPPCRFLYCVT